MSYMFNKCHKLKQIIGINKLITTNVINMESMFSECNELEYINLSNFNTINVKNMRGMFNKCHKLKQIIGINPLASPCAGAPALKYGYVNIETPSPGEAKELIN